MELSRHGRAETGTVIVAVSGAAASPHESMRLRGYLNAVTREAGVRHLVLDLSELTSLDSTSLGVIVGAFIRIRDAGGSLHLAGLTDRPREIIVESTGLGRVIPTTVDTDTALGEIRAALPGTRQENR